MYLSVTSLRSCVARVNLERIIAALKRLLVVAQYAKRNSFVLPRVNIASIDRERLVVARHRLLVVACFHKRSSCGAPFPRRQLLLLWRCTRLKPVKQSHRDHLKKQRGHIYNSLNVIYHRACYGEIIGRTSDCSAARGKKQAS